MVISRKPFVIEIAEKMYYAQSNQEESIENSFIEVS